MRRGGAVREVDLRLRPDAHPAARQHGRALAGHAHQRLGRPLAAVDGVAVERLAQRRLDGGHAGLLERLPERAAAPLGPELRGALKPRQERAVGGQGPAERGLGAAVAGVALEALQPAPARDDGQDGLALVERRGVALLEPDDAQVVGGERLGAVGVGAGRGGEHRRLAALHGLGVQLLGRLREVADPAGAHAERPAGLARQVEVGAALVLLDPGDHVPVRRDVLEEHAFGHLEPSRGLFSVTGPGRR
jgi:hypothetical protein